MAAMSGSKGQGCSLIAFGLFGLVWCMAPAFIFAHQVRTAYRVIDAQRRFVATSGVVLSSSAEARSGENTTTYAPQIRYRYALGPHAEAALSAQSAVESEQTDTRVYVGTTYQFGASANNDSGSEAWCDGVLSQYRQDRWIQVWYDPADPSTAVLDRGIPHGFGLYVAFGQVFIAIGLLLVMGFVYPLKVSRENRRCLAGTCHPGWIVPGWGTLAVEGPVLRLGGRVGTMWICGMVLLGHLLTCLVLAIAMAVASQSLTGSWPDSWVTIALVLVIGLGGGITLAWTTRQRVRRPLLLLDQDRRHLSLTTRNQRAELPWSEIAGWHVCLESTSHDASSTKAVLYLARNDRASIRIMDWDDEAVAAHVAAMLAAATSGTVRLPQSGLARG